MKREEENEGRRECVLFLFSPHLPVQVCRKEKRREEDEVEEEEKEREEKRNYLEARELLFSLIFSSPSSFSSLEAEKKGPFKKRGSRQLPPLPTRVRRGEKRREGERREVEWSEEGREKRGEWKGWDINQGEEGKGAGSCLWCPFPTQLPSLLFLAHVNNTRLQPCFCLRLICKFIPHPWS